MRVLGIDCGTEYTGFGVAEQTHGNRDLVYITCGAIKLSRRDPLPARLSHIYESLCAVMRAHEPEIVAIEEVFYSVNPKSALQLGQVRGVAMLAASNCGLPIAEYAPLSIKAAVVGYGRADKQQVQFMVKHLLSLREAPEPADAADALAIAICHLHTSATHARQRVMSAHNA